MFDYVSKSRPRRAAAGRAMLLAILARRRPLIYTPAPHMSPSARPSWCFECSFLFCYICFVDAEYFRRVTDIDNARESDAAGSGRFQSCPIISALRRIWPLKPLHFSRIFPLSSADKAACIPHECCRAVDGSASLSATTFSCVESFVDDADDCC